MRWILISVAACLIWAAPARDGQAVESVECGAPTGIGDGWQLGTQEAVGLDASRLCALVDKLAGSPQDVFRLNTVHVAVPVEEPAHAFLGNYATHKYSKVLAWLARHPRWTFHFTSSSCSSLNAVETFFAKLTNGCLRRGTFHSPVSLREASNRDVEEHNSDPRPFIWTAHPNRIVERVVRARRVMATMPAGGAGGRRA